ncbi:MAG: hypothetical protein GX811_02040 [Lentisphaerae bacterium]|nr:hypothetical protein [Lentisphaerota bacterium]
MNGIIKTGRQWGEYLGHGVNYINIMRRELGEDATKEYIASKLTQLHSTEQYLNMGGVLRSAGQQ